MKSRVWHYVCGDQSGLVTFPEPIADEVLVRWRVRQKLGLKKLYGLKLTPLGGGLKHGRVFSSEEDLLDFVGEFDWNAIEIYAVPDGFVCYTRR